MTDKIKTLDDEIDEMIENAKSASPVNKEDLHLVSDEELSTSSRKYMRLTRTVDRAIDRIDRTIHSLLYNRLYHEASKLIFYIEIPLTERGVGKPVLSYKVERDG